MPCVFLGFIRFPKMIDAQLAQTVELTPEDAPEPKGKPVVTTTYKDANLYHDLGTGRAVSGVLHFLNQTPIEWFSVLQEAGYCRNVYLRVRICGGEALATAVSISPSSFG